MKINKKLILVLALTICAVTSVFAADEDLGVFNEVGNRLLDVLVSPGLKAALALMLAGTFGGIAFGKIKGQDGIVATLLPVAFGIAGILGAVSIITWIFGNITIKKFSFLIIEAASELA